MHDETNGIPSSCACGHARTKHRSDEERRALLNRLSRIEGQIRGLRAMVEREAYCPDILMQAQAVNAALNSFCRELLSKHIRTCVVDDVRAGREDTVDELLQTLQRMMK